MKMILRRFPLLVFACLSVAAAQNASVTVDAKKETGRINPYLYGLNVARWDEGLFPGPPNEMLLTCDRDAIAKVKAAGFTLLKYPGGNDADQYIWNSPKNSPGEMDTDEYAALLRETNSVGFITVNFNEPPSLAAEWVRYCNRVKGYNIPYWEVGDEQWGAWAIGHTTPEGYGARFVEFAKAMKDVDPTIKIAMNIVPSDDPNGWSVRALRSARDYVDLVTYSWYPITNKNENADTLFASMRKFRGGYAAMRRAIQAALPKEKADAMWVINVGYNSVSGYPGPFVLSMANALYIADMVGTMAELGEAISCYWALHNAYPPGRSDYGILSAEGKNLLRSNYFVFEMFTRHFGNVMLQSSSGDAAVSAYASRRGNDTLSVILLNKDGKCSHPVTIELGDFKAVPNAHVWILDEKRKLEQLVDASVTGSRLTLELPPYSAVVVNALREGATLPPVNLALGAKASASTYSTTDPYFGPGSAVDGKPFTRWASAAWASKDGTDPEWFELDFGAPRTFDCCVLKWAKGYGLQYTLVVSDDGKEWREIVKESDGKGGMEEFNFAPVRARYLRLKGTKGSSGKGTISTYSLYEFEVFDTRAPRKF